VRIIWRRQAEDELAEILDYLLDRDPTAALRIYDAVRDQVSLLADQPGMGRIGRVKDTRELVISRTPYIVAYTIDRRVDAVVVLRVLHGARSWPKGFARD
jgi:toxin ParE1/3/4